MRRRLEYLPVALAVGWLRRPSECADLITFAGRIGRGPSADAVSGGRRIIGRRPAVGLSAGPANVDWSDLGSIEFELAPTRAA